MRVRKGAFIKIGFSVINLVVLLAMLAMPAGVPLEANNRAPAVIDRADQSSLKANRATPNEVLAKDDREDTNHANNQEPAADSIDSATLTMTEEVDDQYWKQNRPTFDDPFSGIPRPLPPEYYRPETSGLITPDSNWQTALTDTTLPPVFENYSDTDSLDFSLAPPISIPASNSASEPIDFLATTSDFNPNDDFEDNSIDHTKWITPVIFDPAYMSVTETDHQLQMALTSLNHTPGVRIFSINAHSTWQIEGDFDIQVDYHLLTWPEENRIRVGLLAFDPNNSEPRLTGGNVERVGSLNVFEPGQDIYLTDFQDGVQGLVETNVAEGQLRLVRSGSTISGYYSDATTAGSWSLIHSGPCSTDPFIASLNIWGSHDTPDVLVAFDNFTVNSGEILAGGSISGHVYESDGKSAIPGTLVWAKMATNSSINNYALTDSNGAYRIPGLPTGNYRVEAYAAGHAYQLFDHTSKSDQITNLAINRGEETPNIDFSLDPGGTISGKIISAITGQPITQVSLVALKYDDTSIGVAVIVDHNGNYVVPYLPFGAYLVFAPVGYGVYDFQYARQYLGNTRHRNQSIRVVISPTNPDISVGDLSLEPGGAISGTVTAMATGEPQANVSVGVMGDDGIWDWVAASGQSGDYSTLRLPYGNYTVIAPLGTSGNDAGWVRQYYNLSHRIWNATPVTIAENQNPGDIDFSLVTSGSITGKVTDRETGEAVTDAACGSLNLSAGWHKLVYRQEENRGGQTSRLAFKAPGDSQWRWFATSELDIRTTPETGQVGLTLTNKKNTWTSTPQNHAEMVQCVDVDATATDGWYGQSVVGIIKQDENIHGNDDNYTSCYEAYFNVSAEQAGKWYFSTDSDDSSDVMLDDQLVAYWYRWAWIAENRWQNRASIGCWKVDSRELVGNTVSNEDGSYTLSGLLPGNYIVEAVSSGYGEEYYQETTLPDEADHVTVLAGGITKDIDFSLQKLITLNFTMYGSRSLYESVAKPVLDEIEQNSGGRIQFNRSINETALENQYAEVKSGKADMGLILPLFLWPNRFPLGGALDFPFAFATTNAGEEAVQAIGQSRLAPESGDPRVLCYFQADPLFLLATKPVNNLADLKGIKIKSSGRLSAEVLSALGASPVSVDMAEVYFAISQGEIQGALVSPSNALDFKLFEVAKYAVKVSFSRPLGILNFNEEAWNEIPADLQNIITQAACQTGYNVVSFDKKAEVQLEQELTDAGGTISELSSTEESIWVEAVKPVINSWIAAQKQAGLPVTPMLTTIKEECQARDIPFPYSIGTISGTVYDATQASSTPLAGATVMLWTANSGEKVSQTTTGEDGSYILENVADGAYKVMAVKTGYAQKFWGEVVSWMDATPITINSLQSSLEINLSLGAGGYIGGTVTDAATGEPIPAITVYIQNADIPVNPARSLPLPTDEDGQYGTYVPLGSYYQIYAPAGLSPNDAYYQTQYYPNSTDPAGAEPIYINDTAGRNNINLTLTSPAGSISGHVYDLSSGEPLAGARIYTVDSNKNLQDPVVTDSSGGYSITGLAENQYQVAAEAEGYIRRFWKNTLNPRKGSPLHISSTRGAANIDFRLEVGGGSIEGTVTGPGPIDNVSVMAIGINDTPGVWLDITNSVGHYKIDGLPLGEYVVMAPAGAGSADSQFGRKYYNDVSEDNAEIVTISSEAPEAGNIDFNLVQHFTNLFFQTNYSYFISGDNFTNTAIVGSKSWGTGMNSPNGDMHEVELNLNSSLNFDWKNPACSNSAPPLYQWHLGDIAQGIQRSVFVGNNHDIDTFSPGFNVTRSVDQTDFTSSGTQTLTIAITPVQSLPNIRLNVNLAEDGYVNPVIISPLSDSPDNTNLSSDGKTLFIGINNPETGHTYTFPITLQLNLKSAVDSLEYMPQVVVSSYQYLDYGSAQGNSITHTLAGAGEWTWQAAEAIRWNWNEGISRGIVLNSYSASETGSISGRITDKETGLVPQDTTSGQVTLSAGWHKLVYRLEDGYGSSIARAAFQAPGEADWKWVSGANLQLSTDSNNSSAKSGIKLTTKKNNWQDRHPNNHSEMVRCVDSDATPESGWYGQSVVDIINQTENIHGNDDHFVAYYETYFRVPEDKTGVWSFATDSDDASELMIDDQVVAAWYEGHGAAGRWEHKGRVTLIESETGEWTTDIAYNADGSYVLTGVTPGNYCILARVPGFVNKYYTEQYNFNEAQPVTITGGASTTNINISVEVGGWITGQVTTENQQPVANLPVYAASYDLNQWTAGSYTGSDGRYSLLVPEGTYRVRAIPSENDLPYPDRYYQNTGDFNLAQAVEVKTRQTTTDINIYLAPVCWIKGTVTDQTGQPIANLHVFATDYTTNEWMAGQNSDENGEYTLALPAGTYRIKASPSVNPALHYADQFYNDTYDYNQAQALTVTTGQITSNINFNLAPGGSISGVIRSQSDYQPQSDISVECYTEDWPFGQGTTTIANGEYTLAGLPYGHYRISAPANGAWGSNDANRVKKYYPNTYHQDEAAWVSVSSANPDVTGINLLLMEPGDINLQNTQTINEDTTWGPEKGIIVVDGIITVTTGATLTIEAGTIIKMVDTNNSFIVQGVLQIQGLTGQPVILTSWLDDSAGGDTNGDGAATQPAALNWQGIQFVSSTARGDLEGLDIRYANYAIVCQQPSVVLKVHNSSVRYAYMGISQIQGAVDIELENCLISHNSTAGIYDRGSSQLVIRNCTVVDNGYGGQWPNAGVRIGVSNVTIDNTIIAFNNVNLVHSSYEGQLPQLKVRNSLIYPAGAGNIQGLPDAFFSDSGYRKIDPLFIDRGGDNYALAAGSPGIDCGLGSGAPDRDLQGRSRYDDLGIMNTGTGYPVYVDMGAYERQEGTPIADLSVTAISTPLPQYLNNGESFSFNWTVTNLGLLEFKGPWEDKIYLSTDPFISSDDLLIATSTHTMTLVPGENLISSTSAAAPSVSGPRYILVFANANRDTQEVDFRNNILASTEVLAVNVPLLPPGSAVTGNISTGQWQFYRFSAAAGNSIIFKLDTATWYGTGGLYLRYGLPPTLSQYDAAGIAPDQPDQEVKLQQPIEGTYYIGVFGRYFPFGTTSFTLTAGLAQLAIEAVSPQITGNTGKTTFEIKGDNFSASDTLCLKLQGGSTSINSSRVYYVDPSLTYVTFDISGAPTGKYQMVLNNAKGEMITCTQSIRVVPGTGPQFDASLILPGLSRPGRIAEIRINYSNHGTNDVASPLLRLQASASDCEWQPPLVDGWVYGSDCNILALGSRGVPTVLRPGQSESIVVRLRIPLRNQNINVNLYSSGVTPNDGSTEAIDWEALADQIRPDEDASDEWLAIIAKLQTQIGANWGDYVEVLRTDADRWDNLGRRVYSGSKLFNLELAKARDGSSNIAVGRIMNSRSNSPVAGMRVSLLDVDNNSFESTISQDDGTFQFEQIMTGTYTVSVGDFLVIQGQELNIHGDRELADIVVTEGGIVQGNITDSQGQVVENVAVTLNGSPDLETETDASGHYVIRSIPEGEYELSVFAPGYISGTPVALTVALGDIKTVNLAFLEGATISGVVRNKAGEAVAGASVYTSRPNGLFTETETDESGNFQFTGLDSGSILLMVSSPGYITARYETDNLSSGEVNDDIVIVLTEGVAVTGYVGDNSTTQPVEKCLVTFGRSDKPFQICSTNTDGQFEVYLEPDNYTVDVSVEGFETIEFSVVIPLSGLSEPLSIGLERVVEGNNYSSFELQAVNEKNSPEVSTNSSIIDNSLTWWQEDALLQIKRIWFATGLHISANHLDYFLSPIGPNHGSKNPKHYGYNSTVSKKAMIEDGNLPYWKVRKGVAWLIQTYIEDNKEAIFGSDTMPQQQGSCKKMDFNGVHSDYCFAFGGMQTARFVLTKTRVIRTDRWLTVEGELHFFFSDIYEFDEKDKDRVWPVTLWGYNVQKYGYATPFREYLDIRDNFESTPVYVPEETETPGTGEGGGTIPVGISVTPEDLFGPGGYDASGTQIGSEKRYIPADQALDYRIEFWNKEDAVVPTQDAVIKDMLDPGIYDLSTFKFTRFGFLKWDRPLSGDIQAIDTRVDLRPEMNIAVDVKAGIDPQSGQIEWTFHCIDPLTGDYPADPMAGFLPPYDNQTGYEIGWVEFQVKAKPNLVSGTQIPNQAFVEFDLAGDMANHPAPKAGPWINTVDASAPESCVLALPENSTESALTVSWTGSDEASGSGLAGFDIYVSDNEGVYTLWLDQTTQLQADFTGVWGHGYRFYSIAIDNVGHREATPEIADAVTTILKPSTTLLSSSVNPSAYGQSVTLTAIVSALAADNTTPTGTITFKDDGAVMTDGVVGLNAGKAEYLVSSLAGGSHSITAEYSGDANFSGSTGSCAQEVVVSLTIDTASLPKGVVGVLYCQTLQASGGSGSGYQWSIAAGVLPSWASLDNTTGIIGGTPDAVGSAAFTIQVTDSDSSTSAREYTLTTLILDISATLPPAEVKAAYSQTLTAVGGSAPYTWSKSGTWPSGLNISKGGVISGKPTVKITKATDYTLTVKVTDSASKVKAAGSDKIEIYPAETISAATVLAGTMASAGDSELEGLESENLDEREEADRPESNGANSLETVVETEYRADNQSPDNVSTLSAAKKPNNSTTKSFTITIYPELKMTLADSEKALTKLTEADNNSAYYCALAAAGGMAPYTWSKGANFPAWLTIDNQTSQICGLSGTPGVEGNITKINIVVTDGLGYALTKSVSLKVNKSLSILTAALPSDDMGVKYKSTTLKAAGGKTPYNWSIADGTLPNGLSMNGKGQISGTPGAGTSGTYSLTFRVSDGIAAVTRTLSITINSALTMNALPAGKVGTVYNLVLASLASGGSGSGYKFTVAGLPAGLKFNSAKGTISGTPAMAGTCNLSIKVTDSLKGSNTLTLTLVIQ
jgi:parallel beta-helix repeat protein